MAVKGGQKGATKEPEFTTKARFWDSYALGLILKYFLKFWKPIMPEMPFEFLENHAFFEAGSKRKNYVSTAPA